MLWTILIAIAIGFLLKYLFTNPSAKATIATSVRGLRFKLDGASYSGGSKLIDKIKEFFDYIFHG